jgi:hypothetical protein
MESRRPRTERSALVLTDLPRNPEALTDPEALALKGGMPDGGNWTEMLIAEYDRAHGDGYYASDLQDDFMRSMP